MKTKTQKNSPLAFIKSQYLWSSFKERILPHLTDRKCDQKAQMYVLPRNMTDTEMARITGSSPIPAEVAASFIVSFLSTADKAKWYIFHTQTPQGVVAFVVDWDDDEWNFYAGDFGGNAWDGGYVFVSFATDSVKLKSGNSEALILKNLVADLKVLIQKYE